MAKTAPTVFVVEDDPSVLRALERLLRAAGYVAEMYTSPGGFLERAPTERPGCAVVDLRMPLMDGLELQQELARRGCPLPIVFLTGHDDVSSAARAMKAGAVAFLTKPCDDTDLLAAVERAVARDGEARAARGEQRALRTRFEALTPREREVCLRVARGLVNEQMAGELGAEERTIRGHRNRVMEKLGVASVVELARLVDRLQGL
ncbi:LuxR family transcriptional regulator [Sorangium cellulosum]|uniref:LuxR family transcriptional regulator n=1 Tax=Sorangium cellulosum TaxID=56 RepID=A0A2L0ESW2_SORCE|nr:response regulator [Sorangium cellulosum]AUX42360.1 LuxR family transcriptional regulator [Sorangium cellulosum]